MLINAMRMFTNTLASLITITIYRE